jgi:hypothetical protein
MDGRMAKLALSSAPMMRSANSLVAVDCSSIVVMAET